MTKILNSKQSRDYIKKRIDEVDDKLVRKILRILQNTGQISQEQIIEYTKSRGIEDVWKHILRIIRDNEDDYTNFIELIQGTIVGPSGEDLIAGTNLYKLFEGIFSPETLEELCSFNMAKNSITRGAGEVLCRLLISDADNGDGDFSFSSKKIEFKSNGGRVRSSSMKSADAFDLETKKLLPYYVPSSCGVFSSESQVDHWFKLIQECDYNIIDILPKILTSQFDSSIDEDVKKIIQNNLDILKNPGKERIRFFLKLIGSIQLYFYHKYEQFDYFLVGEPKKDKHDLNDYIVIDGKELESIESIFNLNSIVFKTLPSTGNPQNAAVRVWLNHQK